MAYQDTYDETRNAFINRQQVVQQNAANQTAGNALATGDYTGAQNALYKAGDIQGGAQVQQYSDTQRVQHAQAAQRISQGIRAAVQAGHTPQDAFAMAVQLAPQMGVDPADVAKLKPAFDQDPVGTLNMVDQQAKKTLEIVNRGNGGYDVVDKANGAVVRAQPGRSEPKVIGGYVYMPQDGQAPAPGTQQATAPPPATAPAPNADAVWSAMKQRESGGNGNAVSPKGALGSTQMLPATAQSMAAKLGVTWRPDLIRGNSPEALQYQDQLGRAYFDEGVQKYGGDLSKGAMYYHGGPNEAIWGPKTHAYAQAVTGGLSAASGQAPPMQGGAAQDALSGPQIPGYTLIGPAKAAKPASPSDSTTVDPNIVKGLIEGRIVPPTQKAAATPYWQAQIQAAATQDPTFDEVNYQARAKTRSDFTSGKSAQNITALNTVIGHLDNLDRTIGQLGNAGPGGALNFGPLNSLNNTAARAIAGASGTDARYKNFETAKTAVANELTRVFRGTGGAEADIQGWMKQLEGAGSPEALHGVVRSMAELINSRIEALGEQYTQGMGTTKDPITLLTPDKQKAFTRLMGGQAPAAPQGQAAAPQARQQAAPKIIRYDAQGNRIP